MAVLEKEPHVGGYLAGYQKKGYRFDTAIHWLNQCAPGGVVTKIFSILGDDFPQCRELKSIRLNKTATSGYLITNNPDDLKKELSLKFPNEKKGIERFFKDAYAVGKSLNKFGAYIRSNNTKTFAQKLAGSISILPHIIPFIKFLPYTGNKLKAGLHKYFRNEALHKMFSSEPDLLSCLVPFGWAYFNDYQIPPTGGGQVIPEWLAHIVQFYESEIFYNCTVTSIITDGEKATGIKMRTRNGDCTLNCGYLIAACDLNAVYNKLLPQHLVGKKQKDGLQKAELYSSSFTLSIALNCPAEALGFGEEMIHLSNDKTLAQEMADADPAKSTLTILAPSVRDKSLAPEAGGTLVVFMPAYLVQNDFWKTEEGNVRGAAYYELKRQIAEQLITRLESVAPDIRKHILFYDAATPVTHWRYTGNTGGTMMGQKPGKKNMQTKVAQYKTPLKNMFIGGHWAELGGGVPIATKAGLNAALLVLKEKKAAAFYDLCKFTDGKIAVEELRKSPHLKPYNNNWERVLTPAERMKLKKL